MLIEGSTDHLPLVDRITTRAITQRPTYDDFFEWIAELATDDDVSIVANTDVWFGNDVSVATGALSGDECFALARWETTGLLDRNDSQDCWIFRGRVQSVKGDFPLGVPRCDNRLMHELQAAGYTVRNPSFSVRAHHVHAQQREEYSTDNLEQFVAPPYGYLWPHNLWSLRKTTWHNLRNPANMISWRFDRRRALQWLPVRAARKLWRMVASSALHIANRTGR